MNTASLTSASAIAQYATSLLAKKSGSSASGATTTTSSDTVAKQLTGTTHDHKTLTAQHALDKQQSALAATLKAGLAKAGVKLGGDVDFSLASDGSVSVQGSDADKAAVSAYLKGDTSKPSLQTQIGTVLKTAQTLSSTVQQTNAISMAAKYAGGSGNVMAMYTSLMGHAAATPAVFALSASASSNSLTYSGMLNSQG